MTTKYARRGPAQRLRLCSSMMAIAAASVFGSTAAQAADGEDRLVVTGSYIAGTPEDAALPVDVITSEELLNRGSPTVLDLIKSLTVTGPVLGDTNQFTTAAQGRIGGGTINLRGLGPQRTLVLMNGRRFQYGQVDTNLIPVSAIGRVEILKDGAAATYGSDAIGGVANFITRTDLEGFEVGGDYRFVDGSSGDWTANGAFGWKGDNANILIAGGYQHRSELSVLDRDWSYQPLDVNPTSFSGLGNPGTLYTVDSFFAPTGTGYAVDSNCDELGGQPGYFTYVPTCYFPYAPVLNLVEKENRYQVYGEANVDFSSNTRLHFEAMYAVNDTPALRSSPSFPPLQGPTGPGSIGVFYSPIYNPGAVTALEQAGYSPTDIANTNLIYLTFWRPFALSGNPNDGGFGGAKSQRKYTMFRTSVSLEGSVSEAFNWQVAGTYVHDTAYVQTPDVLINRLQQAINGFGGPNCSGVTPGANGCEFFNPFSNAIESNPAFGLDNPGYVSANANSDELEAWLFDDILQEAVSDYYVVDVLFNGSTGISLPGGDVGYAIGGQYRGLDYKFDPLNANSNALETPCPTPGDMSCAFPTGPFIFQGQTVPARLTEDVYAAFAELSLPFTDTINAQAAVRFEDYGGLTGSTVNPKFALKWQATEAFAIRGSVGTTFRGPAPANRAPGGNTGLTGIAAAGNAFKSVDFFGNPAVGPEKAFTYNVGAILEAGGLRAIIDYWSYKVEDQIVTVPANIIATAVAGIGSGTQAVDCSHPLRPLITFSNNNTCTQGTTVGNDIQRVRSDTTNGPTVRTSGIDATIDYLFENVGGGDLSFNATISYILKYDQEEFEFSGALVSEAYDAKGYANYDRLPGTISDWRGTFYAQYDNGPHTARLTFNYIDGVMDNRGPTVAQTGYNAAGCTLATASDPGCTLINFGQPVKSFKTVDFNYTLQAPWETTLSFGVFNIFDANPPQARLELSYDPFIGSPYGRTFKIGVHKRF